MFDQTAKGKTHMSILTSKDGTTIAFDKQGQGPAVILVDGAMCYRNAGPMTPLAAPLQYGLVIVSLITIGGDDEIDSLIVSVFPFASVTVTEYVPGARFNTLDVVAPLDQE